MESEKGKIPKPAATIHSAAAVFRKLSPNKLWVSMSRTKTEQRFTPRMKCCSYLLPGSLYWYRCCYLEIKTTTTKTHCSISNSFKVFSLLEKPHSFNSQKSSKNKKGNYVYTPTDLILYQNLCLKNSSCTKPSIHIKMRMLEKIVINA